MCLWLPVVIVEYHDGGDHTACHHEHDAVEVGPWNIIVRGPFTINKWSLPISGLSEVMGIISDTVFRKIVSDNKMVTPESGKNLRCWFEYFSWWREYWPPIQDFHFSHFSSLVIVSDLLLFFLWIHSFFILNKILQNKYHRLTQRQFLSRVRRKGES